MKVTIDLEPGLYRAVKVEAARADRSVREIVDEALAAWLERLEDAEDAAAAGRGAGRVRARRRRGGRRVLPGPRGRDARGVRLGRARLRRPATVRRRVSESPWRVELAPAAQRQLRKLPPGGDRPPARPDPRPRAAIRGRTGAVRLAGSAFWRLRVGDLRDRLRDRRRAARWSSSCALRGGARAPTGACGRAPGRALRHWRPTGRPGGRCGARLHGFDGILLEFATDWSGTSNRRAGPPGRSPARQAYPSAGRETGRRPPARAATLRGVDLCTPRLAAGEPSRWPPCSRSS